MTNAPAESLRRILEDTHGRIDSHLARARSLAASRDGGAKDAFASFLKALLGHISIEESLLLPAYDRGPAEADLTAELRRQHQQIRGKLDQLSEAFGRAAPVDQLLDELLALLCPHEEAEEERLIPVIEDRLTDSEREALVRGLRAL